MSKSKLITLIIFLLITNTANAKQSVETTPWGYSGIINVPNSSVLEKGKFYFNSAYTFKNQSFLSSFQIGLLDNLEIGILGGLPSDIYSGLAGNIKYQILRQNTNIPFSFATGINLLGIKKVGSNSVYFNYGNSIYMIATYDLNINISDNNLLYNILSVHFGFSGNLESANLLAGIDIPITKFINLGVEYISKSNINSETINFGMKIKPIDQVSINLLSLGTNFSQGFTNTQYMLGLSYSSNIFLDDKNVQKVDEKKEITNNKKEEKTIHQINKEEKEELKKTDTNKQENKLLQEGTLKINVFDENDNSQLSNVKVLIETKENNIVGKFQINKGTYTFEKLKYGDYRLILDKENYDTVVYPIKVDSLSKNVDIKMKKNSSSIIGRVFTNNSIPYSDLDISLNENLKTKTDKEGKFAFTNISPGKYILKLTKNNQLLKKIDIDLLKGIELKREIYLDDNKDKIDTKKNDTKKIEIKEDKVLSKDKVQKSDLEKTNYDNKKKEKRLSNALIVGKITSSEKIVSSARITLEGDKVTIITLSNKEGFYLIKNVPSGKYKLTVTKAGFTDKISNIELKENKQYKFDINLDKKD